MLGVVGEVRAPWLEGAGRDFALLGLGLVYVRDIERERLIRRVVQGLGLVVGSRMCARGLIEGGEGALERSGGPFLVNKWHVSMQCDVPGVNSA